LYKPIVLHSASRNTFGDSNKKKGIYTDRYLDSSFLLCKKGNSMLINRLDKTQNEIFKKSSRTRKWWVSSSFRIGKNWFYIHKDIYTRIYTRKLPSS